jgi:HEAT repeat protein
MGSVARESVPSLIQALEDTNNSVRYYSIQSLAKIDSSGAEMIPALVKSLRDSNKSVSAAAAEVLSQMEQDRKMKNLPPFYTNEFEYAMAFVTSVSPQVQIMGIEKLGALQGYDQDVSSALKELSESTNTSVRMQAELALKTK